MKRRMLALLLALTLTLSLALPAAAQPADDALAEVTLAVKGILALDTGAYTDFYGDLNENILAPTWHLEWYGEDSSLSVSATQEGKILSYSAYEGGGDRGDNRFAPSFPAGDRAEARKAAEAFLKRVLTEGESFTMEDSGTDRLNMTAYRFSGEILINGLSADLTYSLSVRCRDSAVTSFHRDDLAGSVMGGIPSAAAAVTADRAREALRDTLELRLEYVLPEDGKQAVLRYLPEHGDTYYVDAATGALVNLDELARQMAETGGTTASGGADAGVNMESSADTALKQDSLTGAEQAGVEKLEGVLERAELDKKVRAIAALGLEKYTLSGVSYTVPRDKQSDDRAQQPVTASLQYGRQVESRSWRRTVTLDAHTGELLSVYSSAWADGEKTRRTVGFDAAREKAEAFLKAQCGENYAASALYNSTDAAAHGHRVSHAFTFAQKVNGYFYPGNTLSVGVDATDGSISSYGRSFDEAVTFDTAEGILTADQALNAWLDTYEVAPAYIRVPAAINYTHPDYRPLKDHGISYLHRLVLGYRLEREDYLLGIDAKSGESVAPEWADREEGLSYTDMDGHWAREKVRTLASYNVGYAGGLFRPDSALTQLDLVALLASTEGYLYSGETEDAADDLYEFAYALGLLEKEGRDDDAVLTRAQTIRLILDAMGYGPVARLQGIFRTGFTDDRRISGDFYGYAALAQGLGMVTDRSLRPDGTTTRAQAAVMLYNLMDR